MTRIPVILMLALSTWFGTAAVTSAHSDTPQPKGAKSNARVEIVVVRSGAPEREQERPLVAGGGDVFSDCEAAAHCPAMVVIPSSEPGLVLGELDGGEPNKRLHGVAIEAFALGQNEVSLAEYEACVRDAGCRPPEWREPGSQFNIETGANAYYKHLEPHLTDSNAPIVGVSYEDAVAYARWLSKVSGRRYFLPSETQWEYAARAGTVSSYWWGSEAQRDGKAMAACRGCGSEWDAKTNALVASFAPNPWGLYNMHGNVWEWVADYYCDDFSSNPRDGSARSEDNCPQRDAAGLRVLRGGSSFYEPRFMRSATRLRNVSGFRNFSVGFRVARSLHP